MDPLEWAIRRTENSIYRWHHETIKYPDLESRRLETLDEKLSEVRLADLMKELRAECRPYRLAMSAKDIGPAMTVYRLSETVLRSLREPAAAKKLVARKHGTAHRA